MVIQEAMASGVPVVASNICGIPYQVLGGKTGFLTQPGNVDDLSARIRELLQNKSLRQEFGLAARKQAQTEFHADSVAHRTIDVYRAILS